MVVVKELPEYPGYKLRSDGKIIGKRGKPVGASNSHYLHFAVVRRNMKSLFFDNHVVLAKAFCTNPRPDIFHCVDHRDGKPLGPPENTHFGNRVSNLRWLNRNLNAIHVKTTKVKKLVLKTKLTKPYPVKIQITGGAGKLVLLWCKCFATEAEAIHAVNAERKKVFEQIYMWLTRPMTGEPPRAYTVHLEYLKLKERKRLFKIAAQLLDDLILSCVKRLARGQPSQDPEGCTPPESLGTPQC